MDKNAKIALGLLGASIFGAGTIVGGFIMEKWDQKYMGRSINNYRELAEKFKDLLCKEYEINDTLKKEVLKMKREEANDK